MQEHSCWNLRSVSSPCPGHPQQVQLPEDQELWAWLRMLLVLGRTYPLAGSYSITHLVPGKRGRPQQPLQNYSWGLKERGWLLEQVKHSAFREFHFLAGSFSLYPYVRYLEGNRLASLLLLRFLSFSFPFSSSYFFLQGINSAVPFGLEGKV